MQYPIKPQKIKAKHAQILWWNWILITYFVICSTKFSDTLLVALILAGFGVLKGSLMVPVETMGSFWPGLGKCMGCVQSRELGARDLPFRVYPAGRLLWLPFVADFAVLGGLMVSVWTMGSFWPGLALSGLWEAYGCVQSRELAACMRALPSKTYPAGKLQWHFTCGFNFRHNLWLPFVVYDYHL